MRRARLVLVCILAAFVLTASATTASAYCGECIWVLDEGRVGGPGHWRCSEAGTVFWCSIQIGACIDGDGGCGESPIEDQP